MKLTEKERELLVDTLIESLWQFPLENTHRSVREMIVHKTIMPNVEGILAERAVPEPDAAADATATDAVERVKAAIRGVLKSAWEDDDEKLIYTCDIDAMARAALAAVPTATAAAGDDLDAMLGHLIDDDLPGKTLSIYRHDGQWSAQQHMTHLEEQYPTDVCGHGDGVLEAVLDAVAKAKENDDGQ